MTKYKKFQAVVAICFFFVWLGILYAGADHPPPPGFGLIIIIDVLSSLVIYFRVGYYLRWLNGETKYRLLRVMFDGLLAGIVIASVLVLFQLLSDPAITPAGIDYLIWFCVMSFVGIINALIVFIVSVIWGRRVGFSRQNK